MKKLLLMGGLSLLIIASIVGGTLATYTKTLAPLEGDITAKTFEIEATNLAKENLDLKIAPGEVVDWKFSIQNYKGDISSMPTEVDMDVYVYVIIPTALAQKDISASFTVDNKEFTSQAPIEENNNTIYTFTGIKCFLANNPEIINPNITFKWDIENQNGSASHTEIEGQNYNFTVIVKGVQHLGASTQGDDNNGIVYILDNTAYENATAFDASTTYKQGDIMFDEYGIVHQYIHHTPASNCAPGKGNTWQWRAVGTVDGKAMQPPKNMTLNYKIGSTVYIEDSGYYINTPAYGSETQDQGTIKTSSIPTKTYEWTKITPENQTKLVKPIDSVPLYDYTSSYVVGDIVWQKAKFWRATQNCDARDTNVRPHVAPTHWEEITIDDVK